MDFLRKYFYGQLTESEEAQVQQWIAEHSDDSQVIEAIDQLMFEHEASECSMPADAFDAVQAKLGLYRSARNKHLGKFVKFALIAASIILLPLLGAVINDSYQHDIEWREIVVPDGTFRELILSDGTHLHLNAGTRVTYPSEFGAKERKIFVDGEVFADVVKNPQCPFVIESGDVNVNVFGTTFNFKSYSESDCVELLLIDGAVTMDINTPYCSKELTLHPGDVLQYDRNNGELEIKPFTPHQYKGFHEGRAIHFFNISLSDIAMDLERYFKTKIVLLDETLSNNRYFALFTNNESLDQILNGINIDGSMKFIKRDGVIYITKK